MKCRQADLFKLISGRLDVEQVACHLEHLGTCPACRERMKVMVALKALPLPSAVALPEKRKRLLVLAAAVLAGALLVSWPARPDRWAPSIVSLAEREPPSLFPLQTRSAERPEPGLKAALEAYQLGEYQRASRLFSELRERPMVLYYRGVCDYLAEDTSSALQHLSGAAASPSPWQAPALWFLAQTRLLRGEPQEALQILLHPELLKGQYATKAHDLRLKIDRLSRGS